MTDVWLIPIKSAGCVWMATLALLLHKHVCTLIGLNCATRESEPIYRDLLRQTLAAAEADIN